MNSFNKCFMLAGWCISSVHITLLSNIWSQIPNFRPRNRWIHFPKNWKNSRIHRQSKACGICWQMRAATQQRHQQLQVEAKKGTLQHSLNLTRKRKLKLTRAVPQQQQLVQHKEEKRKRTSLLKRPSRKKDN